MHEKIPTKRRASSAVFLAALISMAGFPGIHGQASAQEPVTPDSINAAENRVPYDEKKAQSIDGMLMCPVCPAETIDQAQVPIAKQMRRLVREKLGQGESREQILEYFAGVYGQDILAAPSKSGFNLIAWTVPVLGVFAALAAGFFVLRSMSAPIGPDTPGPRTAGRSDTQEDLAPYLGAVDRELGIGDADVRNLDIAESPSPNETGETNVDETILNGGPNG